MDGSKVAAATKVASGLTGPQARFEYKKEIQVQSVEMAMFQQYRNVGQFKCIVLHMDPDLLDSGTANSGTQGVYKKKAFLRPVGAGIPFPFPEPCQLAMNKTKAELLFYIRQHPLATSKNVVFDSEANLPTAGDIVFAQYNDPSNYRSLTFEARNQGTGDATIVRCLKALQGETTTAKQLYGNSGKFGDGAGIQITGKGSDEDMPTYPGPSGGVTNGTMGDIGNGKWSQFWPSGIIGILNKPEEITKAKASIPADALKAAYERIDYFLNTNMWKTEKKLIVNYGSSNEMKMGTSRFNRPNVLSIFDHRKKASEKRLWVLDISNRATPKLIAHAQIGNGGKRTMKRYDGKSYRSSHGLVGNCCNRSSLGLSIMRKVSGTVGKGACAKKNPKRTKKNKYGCLNRFNARRDGGYPCAMVAGLEPWNGWQWKRQVMVHQTSTFGGSCPMDTYLADVQGAATCKKTENKRTRSSAWNSLGCWTTSPPVHGALMEWGWTGSWMYAYNGGPSIQHPKDVDNDCYYSDWHWTGGSGTAGKFTIKSKYLGHEKLVTGGKVKGDNPRHKLGNSAAARSKGCLPYPVY
jgi:hypothetical protein